MRESDEGMREKADGKRLRERGGWGGGDGVMEGEMRNREIQREK